MINDDSIGLIENVGEVGMRIVDCFQPVLGPNVRRDVLHGARAVESDHRGEVFDGGGAKLLDVASHAA